MNKAERVRAARERADKAAAALAAFDKATAERAAASAAFTTRWQAFLRRSRVVMANLAGDYVQKVLAEFHAEFGYNAKRPTGRKAIIAALRGGAKIGGNGYGSSYSLTGLAPRLRVLSRPQVRAVARAEAKMNRAKAALNRATVEWRDAKKAAFEAGAKVSVDQLADALVKREGIRPTQVDLPEGLTDLSSWRRDNLAAEAEQAGIHLAATRNGEECPCHHCVADRQKAQERADQIARIKALPRQKIDCPTHGPTLMHAGTQRQFLSRQMLDDLAVKHPDVAAKAQALDLAERWYEEFPVAWCPKGDWHGILRIRTLVEHTERLRKLQAKAAKKAATAERKGAALPPATEGDAIAFRCPGCGTVNERQDVWRADDDDPESDLLVQCGGCGSEMLATGVARLALEEGKAA